MSAITGTTLEFLNKLAAEQQAYADGKPPEGGFDYGEGTPQEIHDELDRNEVHQAFQGAVTGSGATNNIGTVNTLIDENDLIAAYERATQRGSTSRIRSMSHAKARAVGHSAGSGLIKYAIQEVMVRPDE